LGIKVIPLWSPQADWLFDARLGPADAVRRWRESGIRYVVLTKRQANLEFFNQRSRWTQPPFHVGWVADTESTVIFQIRAAD
jgi:hypothetical protein